ncbi:MAG: acyl carrier protein [Candidatus Omnitrophota bacterium]|jgi:acyl carrier protein
MLNNIPDDLEQDMQQLISEITGRSLGELRPEANFWQDLGIDSIKAIEIAVAIERRYKVSIRDEQIPQIATIGQAVKLVKEALRRKQNGK